KILSATAKKIVLASGGAIVIVLVVLLVVRHFLSPIDGSARQQFLRFVPADATAVCFLDLDDFRASPFLAALYAWAPRAFPDADYSQFVHETGFDYERDLQKVFVAFSNHGEVSSALILAEGTFDRKKLAAYLSHYASPTQQGSLQVY